MSDHHDPQTGRFVAGNSGGPGRPRRAIETDYLSALSEAVPLERWRKIVERAVSDAEQGDAKARAWLSAYLAGKPSENALLKLAASERAGFDPVADEAHDLDTRTMLLDIWRAVE